MRFAKSASFSRPALIVSALESLVARIPWTYNCSHGRLLPVDERDLSTYGLRISGIFTIYGKAVEFRTYFLKRTPAVSAKPIQRIALPVEEDIPGGVGA